MTGEKRGALPGSIIRIINQPAFLESITRKNSRYLPTDNETGNSAKSCGKKGDYLQAIIESLEDELIVVGHGYRIIQANEAVLAACQKRHVREVHQYI